MSRSARILVFAMITGCTLAGAAHAQSSSHGPRSGDPRSGDVAQQFNSGAQRVGHGAAEIGEGIKNGAIMTWQALRDGANTVAHRFDGNQRGHGPNTGRGNARPAQQQR